ncbi:hypothetical protein BDL97_02G188100 [Sphagnum fallax]|nr:hypothetical protein BDL97_02G188100 [Sphagnum fallax]KAH8972308.1 hypothetical protein BDL97_02G188100 [Sphagnum fallax]KAH8972309.1 hypothetical protein BDL97_02G188100 [Sphagnum fallax]KAH8972318.1 hypothetical protein BDL97_02G188100 [Sphagnum fallax]
MGQKRIVEKRWMEFFSDPSQWWDHRTAKVTASYPDFTHKKTQAALWLDGRLKPPWVEARLAAMAPRTVKLNISHWNSRFARYAKAGQFEKTLELFQQMQQSNIIPDSFTFVHVLKACANLQALEEGRCIHTQVIQSGVESNPYVGSSLVNMYAKCGSIEDAWRVFNRMPSHDVVSWNAMIMGHVRCGQGQKALELYQKMEREGVQPVPLTFVGVLNACASVAALKEGKCVHEHIIQSGCESDVFVASSLVDMYAKCGSIEDAWRVFNRIPIRNVVAWNAMILGLVKCGQGQKALELYQQMQHEGVKPGPLTFVGLLNACATLSVLEDGKRVHEQTIQSGCESDIFVASSLINMYAKCGSIEDAQRVFNKMPTRDVVSWSTMILGYVKCGQGQKALELSQQMQHEGVQPVPATFLGMLNACASVAALEEGRHVHEQIIESSCESDAFVSSSLINMYAKCGSLEDAWRVFNRIPVHTTISWNAMLGGCAMHGCAQQALGCFEQMCHEGVDMDRVTFIALLSACGHAGLRDEGLHYFESMCLVYSIPAGVEHYACMVDLHGRAGHLHDAEDLMKEMHCQPNASVWMALLSACRVYGSVEMVDHIAKQVLELDCGNSAGHSS